MKILTRKEIEEIIRKSFDRGVDFSMKTIYNQTINDWNKKRKEAEIETVFQILSDIGEV